MAKIIQIKQEHIEACIREFADAVKTAKMADGKLTYIKNFAEMCSKEKAKIHFTPVAWAKVVMLVQHFSKEVAWHGIAKRYNEETNEYIISDILVYPQEVTGATVTTDQVKYQTWLMTQEDEVFNNIRMQGHSHVNMGVTPSGVDTAFYDSILDQLHDDMFYIFMVHNKSFQVYAKIYDMKKNIMFEPTDISVDVISEDFDVKAFIKDADESVKDKPYTSNYTSGTGYTPGTGYQGGYAGTKYGYYDQYGRYHASSQASQPAAQTPSVPASPAPAAPAKPAAPAEPKKSKPKDKKKPGKSSSAGGQTSLYDRPYGYHYGDYDDDDFMNDVYGYYR